MTATASRYTVDYPELASGLPGQNLPWLQFLRADALASFTQTGFPSPREEEWRYTNVSAIEKKLFSPSTSKTAAMGDKNWLQALRLPDTWSMVFINGFFSGEHSILAGLPDNLTVMNMADALIKKGDSVEKYLGSAVNHKEHGFIAFNTAWFSDGLFVHIPAGQILEKPLQLLHIVTHSDAMATTRNLIIANAQAEAQIIESFASLDITKDGVYAASQSGTGTANAYLTAAVTELFIGPNACVTYYKMQNESEKAYHFGGTYVKQAQNARFVHHNFAFGGLLARSDIHCDLEHAAECELNGLYLGSKRQHIDNHTRINHLQPLGSSRESYKGVLDDSARGVFQGRIIVSENAQLTDSQMNNRNLLLSNEAEADTKPQLEIYADDVKCGHGVTVGQLDEKSIFYLQSRGVDKETAGNMLTFAFANEMVEKIKLNDLHEKVLEQVLLRFPQEGIEKNWL